MKDVCEQTPPVVYHDIVLPFPAYIPDAIFLLCLPLDFLLNTREHYSDKKKNEEEDTLPSQEQQLCRMPFCSEILF